MSLKIGETIRLIGGGTISPMARKVEYALKLKDLDYRLDEERVFAKRSDVLVLNPLGQIPVLAHGAFHIGGSSIICAYLDDIAPERRLVPEDPFAEARCAWIVALADGPMWNQVRAIWLGLIVGPLEGVPPTAETHAEVAEAKRELAIHLDELERHLGKTRGAYVIDDEIRLADLALAALTTSLSHCGEPIQSWGRERWPRVAAYADTLAAIPAIAELYERTEPQLRPRRR